MTHKEIAAELGVERRTVGRYLSNGRVIDYEAIRVRSERAVALQAQGRTYGEIAAELGVSKSQVRRDLRPERLEKDREHSRAYKSKRPPGKCGECGGPTPWGKKGYPFRCVYCVRDVPWDDRPAEAKVRPPTPDPRVPKDVERRVPPAVKLPRVVSAQKLTETFDCQAYGCLNDAVSGEQFCRRHLDVSARTG